MTRNNAKVFGLLLLTIAASVSWQELGARTRSSTHGLSPDYRQLDLFGNAFGLIMSDYVESPDQAKLMRAAINGMLASLDPHSSFMTLKQFKEFQVESSGKFGGLGLEVTMENGILKVIAPLDDTPAAHAGILANDLITHLDGQEVVGMALNEAIDKMRGRPNTQITLTIQRPGKEDSLRREADPRSDPCEVSQSQCRGRCRLPEDLILHRTDASRNRRGGNPARGGAWSESQGMDPRFEEQPGWIG